MKNRTLDEDPRLTENQLRYFYLKEKELDLRSDRICFYGCIGLALVFFILIIIGIFLSWRGWLLGVLLGLAIVWIASMYLNYYRMQKDKEEIKFNEFK